MLFGCKFAVSSPNLHLIYILLTILDVWSKLRQLEILLHTKVTLEDVVSAKLGNVWVMGDEVVQEVGELVALA